MTCYGSPPFGRDYGLDHNQFRFPTPIQMSSNTSDTNTNADSSSNADSDFTNDLCLSPIYGPHNKHQQIPLPEYSSDDSDYEEDDSDYKPTKTRVQPYPDLGTTEHTTEEHNSEAQIVAVVPPNPETVRLNQIEEAKARIRKQTKIRDACELSLYRNYKKLFPLLGPRRPEESDELYEARMNDLEVQKCLIRPIFHRFLDAEKIIYQSYRRLFELGVNRH